jgi:translation initiation factor 2 subunit 1
MTTNALEKTSGIALLESSIQAIGAKIEGLKGSLMVKMKPRAVNESDDLELEQLMAKVGRENTEISGDEDEESDEENKD